MLAVPVGLSGGSAGGLALPSPSFPSLPSVSIFRLCPAPAIRDIRANPWLVGQRSGPWFDPSTNSGQALRQGSGQAGSPPFGKLRAGRRLRSPEIRELCNSRCSSFRSWFPALLMPAPEICAICEICGCLLFRLVYLAARPVATPEAGKPRPTVPFVSFVAFCFYFPALPRSGHPWYP
jgi:hypothetical protein